VTRPGEIDVTRAVRSGSEQFEQAVDIVDRLVERCRNRELTSAAFNHEVALTVLEYVGNEDPRDDVTVLVDYCLGWAEQLSGLDLLADRVMVEHLAAQLEWILERPEQRRTLDLLLADIRGGLRLGSDDARNDLVELCSSGLRSHPRVFAGPGRAARVLEFAAEYRVVEALAAAVRPTAPDRIAGPQRDDGRPFALALDLLGHLASDPLACGVDRVAAQDTLIDLIRYVAIGGAAAIRLPAHRLDDRQRDELLEVLADWESKWGADDPGGMACTDIRRDIAIIRSVLWQAADAAHLGWS
jgi:hypothetical protein